MHWASLLALLSLVTFVSPMVRPAAGAAPSEGWGSDRPHAPMSGVLDTRPSRSTKVAQLADSEVPDAPAAFGGVVESYEPARSYVLSARGNQARALPGEALSARPGSPRAPPLARR